MWKFGSLVHINEFRKAIAAASRQSTLATLLALSPCAALAGGFEVQQSAYFQGMSFAGAAAGGPSLASISWNPAASAFAGPGLNFETSFALVLPEVDLTVLNPGAQPPPPGAAQVDMGRDSLLGASYSAGRITDKIVLGVTVTAPFGLVSKPDDMNWAGRFVALTTKIFTVNVAPSVSYEIFPGLAIGGGAQFQFFDVKQLRAQTPLGDSNIEGNDFGAGFVAGINFSPSPSTSIGLGFRSSVHHQVAGDTTIHFNSGAAQLGLIGSATAPITADVELPEKVTFSFRQGLSPRVRVLGTVDWANWSRFGVIPVQLQSPLMFGPVPLATGTIANLDFRWRDGWLLALGGEYDWSPNLTLRAGVGYEVSPIDSATSRLVQVPDSDHTWASIGATYRVGPSSSIDFAYSHGFFEDDAPFNRLPESTQPQGIGPLLGEANVSVDIISVGWRVRWGGSSYPPEALK